MSSILKLILKATKRFITGYYTWMGVVQACHPIVIAYISNVFDFKITNVAVSRDKIVAESSVIASFRIRVAF